MKIEIRKFAVLTATSLAGIMMSCTGSKQAEEHQAYAINTFEDNPYLAEVWWGDDYDEAVATAKLNAHYLKPDSATTDTAAVAEGGACSSWHKDNFHGRNIDWNMKDFATVIVHMPRNESKGIKYASVGLIAGNPKFTKDVIENNKEVPEALRAILPATIVDGINECGVAINHNIVPYEGEDYVSTGDMPSIMVCRYVLDHCATAKEAVDSLSQKNVYQSVVKLANDYSHFFISDATSSYVVEWIKGKFVATEFKADGKGNYLSAHGNPAVMTNYFIGSSDQDTLLSAKFWEDNPTAMGVERAQTIMQQLPAAKTMEDHMNICKSVWYRQFCMGKTKWYTENSCNFGVDKQKGVAYWWYPTKDNMHWMQNADINAAAKDMLESPEMQNYFKEFNEKWQNKCVPENTYWFTQHSVVYDLKEKKGYILMQEGINSDKVVTIDVE